MRFVAMRGAGAGSAIASAYVPLSFAPEEAYQFDWSHEVVLLNRVTVIVKAAHVRLCHSRMLFVRAYPRESQEMVFDAHDRASAQTVDDLDDGQVHAISPSESQGCVAEASDLFLQRGAKDSVRARHVALANWSVFSPACCAAARASATSARACSTCAAVSASAAVRATCQRSVVRYDMAAVNPSGTDGSSRRWSLGVHVFRWASIVVKDPRPRSSRTVFAEGFWPPALTQSAASCTSERVM